MLKNLPIRVFALMLLVPGLCWAKGNPDRCIQRVINAGCYVSHHDRRRARANVADCKEVRANGDKLEAFELANTGKLVVVDLDATGGQYCATTKYTVDYAGIKTMKVIAGKLFMLSYSGRVYFMMANEQVYEVLNSKGRSYSNVWRIKGADYGQAVRLIGPGYRILLTMSKLQDKVYRGQVRAVYFYRSNTSRSLFRDE